MFERGYLTVARLGGVPIRLHWTLPVGAFVFGRFAFVPGFWLGFFLLVLIHELGHASLVRRYRLAVEAVEIHGLGGQCRYSGHPNEYERSVIAWGGVLGQALLGAVTLLVIALLGRPTSAFGAQLVHAFTWVNLWIAGLNLLPFHPLDGARAWRLIGLWREGAGPRRRGRLGTRRSKRERRRAPAGEPFEGDADPSDLDALDRSIKRALQEAREATRRRRDGNGDDGV